MQESKGRGPNDDPKLDRRKSAATNDETLSDIEESDTTSTSTSGDHDPGPSPDGTLDEPDEAKDAGPM